MERAKTLQLTEQKPDKVSQYFVLILAQRFNFKQLYIPFKLKLFNYIDNND